MIQIPKFSTHHHYPKISFKGASLSLVSNAALDPLEVKILPDANDYFARTILNYIQNFPSYWLNKFKQENYKVIISKRLQDAFKSEKINAPEIKYLEQASPIEASSTTYIDKIKGIKFFTFNSGCTDCLMSAKNNVNHELCHGIVDIKNLTFDKKALSCLYNEINKAKNSKSLSPEEKIIGQTYFWNKQMEVPKDEIMADILAWNMGAGKYNVAYMVSFNNNLMNKLFPNLSEYLRKTVEHIKD